MPKFNGKSNKEKRNYLIINKLFFQKGRVINLNIKKGSKNSPLKIFKIRY